MKILFLKFLRKAIFFISLPFNLLDILIDLSVDSFITFNDFNNALEKLFTACTNSKDKKAGRDMETYRNYDSCHSTRFNNNPLK